MKFLPIILSLFVACAPVASVADGPARALPACFEGAISKTDLVAGVTNEGTVVPTGADADWALLNIEDTLSIYQPSQAYWSDRFTITTDRLQFTSLGTSAVRYMVSYIAPTTSSNGSNTELAVSYGSCPLDLDAQTGDPRLGVSRVQAQSADHTGGVGVAVFDLLAGECFAVVTRVFGGTAATNSIKSWGLHVRRISTDESPCL